MPPRSTQAVHQRWQSIALDLARDIDRMIFGALLAPADVLIKNVRPGAMQRLGYGWKVVQARGGVL